MGKHTVCVTITIGSKSNIYKLNIKVPSASFKSIMNEQSVCVDSVDTEIDYILFPLVNRNGYLHFFTFKKLLVDSMGFRIYVNTINAGDFHLKSL